MFVGEENIDPGQEVDSQLDDVGHPDVHHQSVRREFLVVGIFSDSLSRGIYKGKGRRNQEDDGVEYHEEEGKGEDEHGEGQLSPEEFLLRQGDIRDVSYSNPLF